MLTIRRTPVENRTRIEALLDEHTVVSHLSVVDLRMRIGDGVVRCGGIAGVGTDRAQRNKGYARAVLEDSLVFMHQEGYHLSALFGITDFYPKFGYASAFVDCTAEVMTRFAERAQPRYPVREFTESDAPAVAVLYEMMHAAQTGAIVRDPATWTNFRRGSRWSDRVSAFVVVEGERIVGYASYDLDPWSCTLAEIGYADAAVFSTILARAAEIAWERRTEKIMFCATPDDPFVRYCHRYGCDIRLGYPCCSGGMARVINQGALLAQLQPVLARRLAAGLPGWEGTIAVTTDLGTDRLTFGRGRQQVQVEMPQWMFAQLVLGYRSPADVASEASARIDPPALSVLCVLFPEGYPYIYCADRF